MIIQATAACSLSPSEQIQAAANWLASNELSGTAAVLKLKDLYSIKSLPEARRLYTRAKLFLTEGMELPPAAKREYLRRKLMEKAIEGLDSDNLAERRFALACADRVAEDPEVGLRRAKNLGDTPAELDALKDVFEAEYEVVE